MGVQHGAGATGGHDFQVKACFGGRNARTPDDDSLVGDLEDVRRRQVSLVSAAPRDGNPQRRARQHGAEVSARTEDPAARVEPASDLGQTLRHIIEGGVHDDAP